VTPGVTPAGTLLRRTFLTFSGSSLTLAVMGRFDDVEVCKAGGGFDSRSSIGSRWRDFWKPVVRKSRCVWAAWRLVSVSRCSSLPGGAVSSSSVYWSKASW